MPKGARTRTASCSCGALRVTVSGEPVDIYGCACSACQRASGSSFTYTALFPDRAVLAITGPHRSWRRNGASGGEIEHCFCPNCGSPVFGFAQALPGVIQIAVGCLGEPAFPPPGRIYWSQHRHQWMAWPEQVRLVEGQ